MNLEIGTRIDRNNWHLITPGTRFQETYSGGGRPADIYMLDTGLVSSFTRRWHSPVFGMLDYGLRVAEVPNFERTSRQGSLAAFKQKVGTVTYGQSQLHGVSRQPAIDAVAALGLHNRGGEIGVGMWVHSNDERLVGRLRDHNRRHGGLLLGVGDPNYQWGEYGVWRDVDESSFIEGGVTRVPVLTRVLAINHPETDQYLLAPEGNEDEEIAQFKGTVWAMGMEAKRVHRWCPSFEASMSILGLGENVGVTAVTLPPTPPRVAPPMTGEVVESAEVQAAMPQGAVFMYPADGSFDGGWCWLQRDDSAPFAQATSHLFGPNGGHHSPRLMVLWDGQGQMRIPIPSPVVQEAAPVGTKVTSYDVVYQKIGTDQWEQVAPAVAYPAVVRTRDFWSAYGTPAANTGYRFMEFPQVTRQPH